MNKTPFFFSRSTNSSTLFFLKVGLAFHINMYESEMFTAMYLKRTSFGSRLLHELPHSRGLHSTLTWASLHTCVPLSHTMTPLTILHGWLSNNGTTLLYLAYCTVCLMQDRLLGMLHNKGVSSSVHSARGSAGK